MKYFFVAFGTLLLIGMLCFGIFIYWGNPLNDVNLWRLESYYAENIRHPQGSVLLERKTYLGGPDDHGSHICLYVVGELRTSPLSRDEISRAYDNRGVALQFLDHTWMLEHPWGDWQSELQDIAKQATGTPYFIYVEKISPYWGDHRCDD